MAPRLRGDDDPVLPNALSQCFQGNVVDALSACPNIATPNIVIPAKAGIQCLSTVAKWIPAFAGMTTRCCPMRYSNAFLNSLSK
jgi:hypothetical protein